MSEGSAFRAFSGLVKRLAGEEPGSGLRTEPLPDHSVSIQRPLLSAFKGYVVCER